MLAEEALGYLTGFRDDSFLPWHVLVAHEDAPIDDDGVNAAAARGSIDEVRREVIQRHELRRIEVDEADVCQTSLFDAPCVEVEDVCTHSRSRGEDIISLARRAVEAPSLPEEGSELHRYDHVEVVRRRAAVRTDTDADATALHLLVLEGVAAGELHVGGGVVHDGDVVLRQQVHFLIIYPDDVRQYEVLAEDTELLEVAHRAEAVLTDTFLYLALGLREVQVDLHTVLYCELMAELQLLSAHRIDSVWAEGEGDAVAELAEALHVLVTTLAVQCSALGVALVEERVGEVCT